MMMRIIIVIISLHAKSGNDNGNPLKFHRNPFENVYYVNKTQMAISVRFDTVNILSKSPRFFYGSLNMFDACSVVIVVEIFGRLNYEHRVDFELLTTDSVLLLLVVLFTHRNMLSGITPIDSY